MIETKIVQDMTITHRDFFRLLPKALKDYTWQQQKDSTVIIVALSNANVVNPSDGEITISLSAQEQFKIGSLTLPITHVTFQIKNVVKKTQDDFFHRFDRAYQRGGG